MTIEINQNPYEWKKQDFLETFPTELSLDIFSYLTPTALARCLEVNKTWRGLATTQALWDALFPSIAINEKKWAAIYPKFQDVLSGVAPTPFPRKLFKILKDPCSFWEGKRVEQTHMLTLIIENISLMTLGDLVNSGNTPTRYRYFNDRALRECDKTAVVSKAYWVLMTKDPIPNSKNKTYPDQCALLAQHNQDHHTGYQAPLAIEAAASVFAHYGAFGELLYPAQCDEEGRHVYACKDGKPINNSICTYCQEPTLGFDFFALQAQNVEFQALVGFFGSTGLVVSQGSIADEKCGMAALWKF